MIYLILVMYKYNEEFISTSLYHFAMADQRKISNIYKFDVSGIQIGENQKNF